MKVSGNKIKLMAKDSICMLMVQSMRVNGLMIYNMGMELKSGWITPNIKVILY